MENLSAAEHAEFVFRCEEARLENRSFNVSVRKQKEEEKDPFADEYIHDEDPENPRKTRKKKSTSVWQKIVSLCEGEISTSTYIRTFFYLKKKDLVDKVYPNQLLSQRAVEHARKWQLNRVKTLRTEFDTQKSYAYSQIKLVGTWGEDVDATFMVLSDADSDLSSLFRYALAYSESAKNPSLAQISDELLGPAAVEFLLSPEAYQEAWPDNWLPDELTSNPEKIYWHVFNKG